MNNNRISKQFDAIFGIFMVCFYLGIINKALLRITGGAFIIMGLYRIYSTYRKITQAFSRDREEDE
jgi:hypothetical protein